MRKIHIEILYGLAYTKKDKIGLDCLVQERRLHDITANLPFSKNPPISKVFRAIGLADELGSGMRNTYKYTRLYSGAEPEFKEGDVFRTVIPLSEAATATVGPVSGSTGLGGDGVTPQVTTQVITERMTVLVEFCAVPRSKKEMMDYLGLANVNHFRKKYLIPLLEAGNIRMTIPDKPNSRNQKYVKV